MAQRISRNFYPRKSSQLSTKKIKGVKMTFRYRNYLTKDIEKNTLFYLRLLLKKHFKELK